MRPMPGLPRFPLTLTSREQGIFRLAGSDYHHLVHVLRIKEGDRISLFGDSLEYTGIVDRIGTDIVEGHLEEATGRRTEPLLQITLFQGVGKLDKIDLVVQKATELGVAKILPVITEYSRSHPLPPDFSNKVTRWRKIAAEAAKQSGRTATPEIAHPLPLETALCEFSGGGIFFWENEAATFREVVKGFVPAGSLGLIVGPEGGLTEAEAKMAAGHGFIAASLGPRILRTETAGIVAVALAAYHYGELG